MCRHDKDLEEKDYSLCCEEDDTARVNKDALVRINEIMQQSTDWY